MKKSVIVLALLIAFSSQLTSLAFEQGFPNMPPPANGGMHRPGFDLGQKLNLTDAQKKQAEQLRAQSRTKIEPLIDQLKAERAKIEDLQKSNASQDQLQAEIQKLQALRKQARAIHEQNMKAFEQILTPAQKTQFEKIKQERMKQFKEMQGPKLNLTDAQKAQAKQIREQSRTKMQPLFEQMQAERAKFEELQKNNAPHDQLQAQKEKMHALMKQARAIHEQNMQAFEQILTPEQKAQFEQNKKQMQERFKQRRQDHPEQFNKQ